MHLNNAYNATTGNFDLSKFNKSLNSAGTSVSALSTKLLQAGTTGQQAFAALAQSIAKADRPMLTLGTKMQEFLTTLKNTARWQFSSSMLHTAIGTIQSAWRYAQDLNESLNNIRIVTGQSVEEMAAFADQANKAAKALSTTTTEYTNASLIYYQQGLNDQQVKERTDATIKMANVSRQSAETVSDQMTAIWNNFDNGSKSLEYYGDVITALGAKTASSSQEIATGLEKFAAVADTVGLSYEYATAALATVTATTRQSADVVGTAFKTLFARIQGLNLGETLDDGTTLNKYSQALMNVGINIKDQNGQLKDMDTLLNEIGSKWDTLAKDQQIALAQSVAGVRQYTQLIALMDEWDYFKENLSAAKGSEGALNKQAEIYAESWEAASDRAKASAETIWQNLLDDKFFIRITNGFAQILGGIGEFTKGIGGLKGAFAILGTVVLSSFGKKIPEAINNLKHSFTVLTKGAQAAYQQINDQMQLVTQKSLQGDLGSAAQIQKGSSLAYAITSSNELATARSKLAMVNDQMSVSESQLAEATLTVAEATQQEILALKQKNEETFKTISTQAQNTLLKQRGTTVEQRAENLAPEFQQQMLNLESVRANIAKAIADGMAEGAQQGEGKVKMSLTSAIDPVKIGIQEILKPANFDSMGIEGIRNSLKAFADEIPVAIQETMGLKKALTTVFTIDNKEQIIEAFKQVNWEIELTEENVKEAYEILRQLFSTRGEGSQVASGLRAASDEAGVLHKRALDASNALNSFNPKHIISTSEGIAAAGALIGNASMAIMSLSNTITTLNNPDTSGWEKFSSILMSASMLVPAITMGISNLTKIQNAYTGAILKTSVPQAMLTMSSSLYIKALDSENKKIAENIIKKYLLGEASEEVAKDTLTEIFAKQFSMSQDKAAAAASQTLAAAKHKEAAAHKVASKAQLASLGPYVAIAAIIIAVVAGIIALATAQKRATKAVQETNDAYRQAKEELENLKTELQSVQDKIDELEAKDDLTIIEREELAKLKETEASLERQIALQERLTQVAYNKAANTFSKKAEQLDNWIENARFEDVQDKQSESWIGDRYAEGSYDEQIKALEDNYTNGVIDQYSYESMLENIQSKQEDYEKARDNWIQKNQESYNAYLEGFQNYFDKYKNDPSKQKNILEYAQTLSEMNKFIYGEDYDKYLNAMNDLWKSDEKASGIDVLDQLAEGINLTSEQIANGFSQSFKDSLLRAGILPDDFAQHLIDESQKANEQFNFLKEIFGGEGNKEEWQDFLKDMTGEDWEILANIDLTGVESLEEVIALIEEYKNSEIGVDVNVSTKEDFVSVYKATKNLKTGDSLDPETYGNMIDILGEKFQEFFAINAEGEYQLIAKTKEFQAAVEGIQISNINQQISDNYESIDQYKSQQFKAAGMIDAWGGKEEISSVATYTMQDKEGNNIVYYDAAKAQGQMRFLEIMGQDTSSYLDENGQLKLDTNSMIALSNAVKGAIVSYEGLDGVIGDLNTNNSELEGMLASSAQNLDELAKYADVGSEAYKNFFDTVFEREVEAEEFNVDEVIAYADALREANKATIESDQEAKRLALAHQKLNRGLSNLADNWTDWSKAMESSDLTEKSKAIAGLRDAMSDITGTDMSELPASFFEAKENAELLEKAMKGDKEAIDDLTAAATKSLILEMKLDTSTTSDLQTLVDDTLNAIETEDLTVGTSLDQTGMLNGFQSLLASGAVTVDQMNAILEGIGYDPQIEYKEITLSDANVQELQTSGGITVGDQFYPIDNASEVLSSGATTVKIPVINGEATTYKGGAAAATGGKSSGGGGGGGGKAPTRKKLSSEDRYKEINDKLETVTNSLKDYNRELDSAYGMGRVKAMDKVLDALEKEQELLKEKITLARQYRATDKEALLATMRGTDKEYDSLADFGIQDFIIDPETGNISNVTQVWNDFYSKYNSLVDESEAEGTTATRKAEIQTILDSMDTFEEKLRDDFDRYDESNKDVEAFTQELKDKIVEEQETRYDKWAEQLDHYEELNNHALEELDRILNYFSDSFFARAEKLVAMQGIADIYNISDAKRLIADREALDKLWNEDSDGDGNKDINQEGYVDGLKKIEEQANNAIDKIYEYMKDMSTYYQETIEQSMDILEGVTDQFGQMRSVLEHFSNIYSILGGENDYDTQIKVLQTQRDSLLAEADAWGSAYKMYSKDLDVKKEAMLNAEKVFNEVNEEYRLAQENGGEISAELQARYDTASMAYEEAKNSYQAQLEAAQGSQEKMLEIAEEYAQTIRDIYTKELEKYGKELEKAALSTLDGISSFDDLNNRVDQAKSLTEDWLTNTNKIYETNKLINKAQSEIDKTTNSIAKKKLKGFMDETEQLQKQAKLSNFELEVQEAKYNLLLAEIALEEAQNAKSVVRMRRDSEGNYGYVYTADADTVSGAQQDYYDAENELYNIRLNGANEFVEKRIAIEQEYWDKLEEISTNENLSEEEKAEQRAALMNWYQQMIQEYSRIYQVAIAEDSRIATDAWSTEFSSLVLDTESWKNNTTTYISNVKTAYEQYQRDIDGLNAKIKESMGLTGDSIKETLEDAMRQVGERTKELTDYIGDETKGLIKSLNDEIGAVDNAANHWRTELLPELEKAIKYYKELALNAGKDWKTLSEQTAPDTKVPEEGQGEGQGGQPTGDTTNGNGNKENKSGNSASGVKYYATVTGSFGTLSSEKVSSEEEAVQKGLALLRTKPTITTGKMGKKWYAIASINGKELYNTRPKYILEKDAINALGGYATSLSSQGYEYKIEKSSFDTGGYTGSWGPEGKLAMLHQKELVLNADDTENMLQAISFVRDIMTKIDSFAAMSSLSSGLSLHSLNDSHTTLDQQVSIEANFPNVTSRYEIEAAFSDLVNKAAQFANRKKL